MDLTDKNNEKFVKMIEILGANYSVTFYYNRMTKEFQTWGISRGGFSPAENWIKIIEQYIIDNHEYELRSLAEYEIKLRAGLTPEQRAERSPIEDDGEGVRRFYGNRSVD